MTATKKTTKKMDAAGFPYDEQLTVAEARRALRRTDVQLWIGTKLSPEDFDTYIQGQRCAMIALLNDWPAEEQTTMVVSADEPFVVYVN